MEAANAEQMDRPRRRSGAAWVWAALAAGGAAWWLAAQGSTWQAQALRSPLSIKCGTILAGGAAALTALGSAMIRLARRRRGGLHGDQGGVAMLEFVLLFPIAMAIVLVMIQSAMLATGNLVVHYGAYCAARSAVVWIPRDLSDTHGEPRNVVRPEGASHKRRQITEAAALGLLPVAGGVFDSGAGYPYRTLVGRVYERFHDRPFPAGWDEQLGRRYAYASDSRATWVELSEPTWEPDDADADDDSADGRLDGRYDNGTGLDAYGDREDIRVTLHHRFYLSVPYAAAVFGDEIAGHPGHYATEIVAGYTLMNQGRYDNVVVEEDPRSTDPDSMLLPH